MPFSKRTKHKGHILWSNKLRRQFGEMAWLWYDWKLTDSNITSHFPRAGVVFDSRNIIQGIELCEPKKVGDYLILGTGKLPKIEKAMKKRGITKEQYAVAPVDIFNSEHLNSVDE